MKINLLNWREQQRVRKNYIFNAMLASAIIIGISCSLIIKNILGNFLSQENTNNTYLSTEITKVKKTIKKIVDLKEERKSLFGQINEIQKLQTNRHFVVDVFNDVAVAVPGNMILTKLSKTKNNISFQGIVIKDQVVADFIKNLMTFDWVVKINLQDISSIEPDKDKKLHKERRAKIFKLTLTYLEHSNDYTSNDLK